MSLQPSSTFDIFSKLSAAKIKAGVFVGPQINNIIGYNECVEQLCQRGSGFPRGLVETLLNKYGSISLKVIKFIRISIKNT